MRGQRSRLAYMIGGVTLVASVAAPSTLFAQSQPQYPVPLPVPKTPAAQSAPAGAAPQAQPAAPPTPSTAPPGQRDPFDPLVKKPGPGEERRIQEIAGLKLVGVIWDPKNPGGIRALVETPDGLGYYLRVNEEKFGGKVVTIERDRVQFSVREDVPGGASRMRTVDLRMAKPDGQ